MQAARQTVHKQDVWSWKIVARLRLVFVLGRGVRYRASNFRADFQDRMT